jgi:hypothetical protein
LLSVGFLSFLHILWHPSTFNFKTWKGALNLCHACVSVFSSGPAGECALLLRAQVITSGPRDNLSILTSPVPCHITQQQEW